MPYVISADGVNDSNIELWNEVWNDVIGSMEVALSKHKIAILVFLRESFGSPAWSVKTQVRRADMLPIGDVSRPLLTVELVVFSGS